MGALDTVPFVLRDFEKNRNDYAGVARVATAVWPDDPTTAKALERDDRHRKPTPVGGRVVAERDGRIIAFGVYGQPETPPGPGVFYLNVLVHPDHRRRGVGTAVYDHILGVVSRHGIAILTADTRENQTGALGFLNRRGFQVVERRPVLHLDVEAFDKARFLAGRTRRTGPKITVSALSDLMRDVPDWKRKCWDLDWDIVQDIPSPDTPTRASFARYARHLDDPAFTPQSWFIARQGDVWAGMSILEADPSTPGTFYTSVTGVRRGFRRQGIATALKLHGIAYVRARNGRIIETDNDETSPMLVLNRALGFEPGPALLELRKTF